MPRKKNNNRRFENRASQFSERSSGQANVAFIRTRAIPFRVTQASSGTGGITTVDSGASVTAANSVTLDPFTMGGRFAAFATQFQEYRIARGVLTYIPDTSSNGLVDIVAGATTTPSYENRTFSIGLFRDVALGTITYSAILEAGGALGSTSRQKRIRVTPTKWLWTSTTSASPTTIDLRMVAFGRIYFSFFNPSTTATASYGHIMFDLFVEFRGAIQSAAPVGIPNSSTSPPSTPLIEDEDEKAFTEVKKGTLVLGKPRTLERRK